MIRLRAGKSLGINRVLLVLLLGSYFWVKHALVRLRLSPLSNDPCDAVGAFAFLLLALAAVWWIALLCGWHRKDLDASRRFELRTHATISLATVMTLLADGIVLSLHLERWSGVAGPTYISCLIGVPAAVTLLVLWRVVLIWGSALPIAWTRLALFAGGVAIVIAVTPEWPHAYPSAVAHVVTVAIGGLVLFVPFRPLLLLLLPDASHGMDMATRDWTSIIAGLVCVGVSFGAMLHSTQPGRRALVAMMLGGLLIAMALWPGRWECEGFRTKKRPPLGSRSLVFPGARFMRWLYGLR